MVVAATERWGGNWLTLNGKKNKLEIHLFIDRQQLRCLSINEK
jgi:hypothetical protein